MTTNNNNILRRFIILITILCLVLVGMAVHLATPTAMAFAETSDDYSQYTETKVHNGLSLTDYINDYNTVCQMVAETEELCKGTYFASRFALDISFIGDLSATITGDDPIVNFIPRELFTRENETFVSGNGYSFYIYTSNKDTSNSKCFKSTVAIFDAQDTLQGDYQYKLTVTPILLLDYIYVTTEVPQIKLCQTKVSPYATAQYSKYCTIQLSNGISNAIIPCPSEKSNRNYEFATSGRISVERMSFSSTVYNVNSYNQGDTQYDIDNDYGYFIIGADYNYLFSQYKRGTTNPYKSTQFVLNTLECALNLVVNLTPILSECVDLYDLTNNFVAALRNQGAVYNETNQSYYFNELLYYTTRATQKEHYDNLVKNVLMYLKVSAKNHTYFSSNDHATGIVQLSHTDKDDGSIEYSQLNTHCWIEITKPEEEEEEGGQKTLYTCQISKTIDLSSPQVKQAQPYLPNGCYILPDDSQTFALTLTNNGLYDFVVPAGTDLYIDQVLQTGNNGRYTLQLRSNQIHTIRLVNNNAYSLSSTWSADIAEVGTNTNIPCSQQAVGQSFLVKYKPIAGNLINVSLDQGQLTAVYNRNDAGTYTFPSILQPYTATQSLDMYVSGNNAYYFAITLSAATPTVKVSISSITKQLSETNNTTAYNLLANDNYRYARFVPSKTNHYYFVFNGLTDNNYYNYLVLDSNGTPCSIQQSGRGVLCATAMQAGQTYYIGVSSSFAVHTTPSITAQEPTYFWRIYKDGTADFTDTSDTGIILQAGHTYQFQLWMQGSALIPGCRIYHDFYGLGVTNNGNGIIVIDASRRDNTEFTIVADVQDDVTSLGNSYAALEVLVQFDLDKCLSFADIDYSDKICIGWTLADQKDVSTSTINYTLRGKKGVNRANFSYSGIYIAQNTNGTYSFDMLPMLAELDACYNVTLFVDSISIPTGIDNKQSHVPVGRTYDVNCQYATTLNLLGNTIYTINNELHLYNMRYVQQPKMGLGSNITIRYYSKWVPIPSLHCNFSGFYQTISGLHLSKAPSSNMPTVSNVGLFEVVNGTIGSVRIVNASFAGSTALGKQQTNIGFICGTNNGKISNCTVTGSIIAQFTTANVGGIAGYNTGTISNCKIGTTDSSQTTLSSYGNLGGIAACSGNIVDHCTVQNTKLDYRLEHATRAIGGIVGHCTGGEVYSCTIQQVTINLSDPYHLSGYAPRMGYLVGWLANAELDIGSCDITNCTYNLSSLSGGYRYNCFQGPSQAYGRNDNGTIIE